jgi:glucose/arabinose dehydrogenase
MMALTAPAPAAVSLDLVAEGFIAPLVVTHAGDGSGRIFVAEQGGRIRIVDAGGPGVHPNLLDISSQVFFSGERGLLGVAFHPDYDGVSERRFYVHYTASGGSGVTTLSQFETVPGDPDTALPASEEVLFTLSQPFVNHNGGTVAFGPESPDRHLYLGLGDGGSGGDPGNRAQNTANAFGAILRIDVDSPPDSGLAYHIPAGNPFAGSLTEVEEIFAFGLRNPFRFSFDRGTGTLFIGDVGQVRLEEIDVVDPTAPNPGHNFGWRIHEGTECFNPSSFNNPLASCTSPPNNIFPLHEYSHSAGNDTVIGGHVYRGVASPALTGKYIFGDFGSGRIWTLDETSPGVWSGTSTEIATLGVTDGLTSFGEDEDGEVYVCNAANGRVFRISDPTVPAGLTVLGHDLFR